MKATSLDDVIAAISTPQGIGGISIIRMSGKESIAIADKIFKRKKNKSLLLEKSHTIHYGMIIDPETESVIDEVLLMLMKEPNTYTKETVIEINCHGGILIAQTILSLLLRIGARLAEPGEFTKRAFLNGRIDLTQAEAVIDMIEAKTELSRKSAVNQLEGRLGKEVQVMRNELLDMIAAIEAAIDYPEHDVEEDTYHEMYLKSSQLMKSMQILLDTADRGKIIKEGIETVIIGKPNVGKSSLLNRLLDEERAIVTDIAGTTRDTVEELLNLDGIILKISDTAGIRETKDTVEKIGVEKSKEYAKKADLVLFVLDASKELEKEDYAILELIKKKKSVVLLNKSDLGNKIAVSEIKKYTDKENIISISVKKNNGIEKMIQYIKKLFYTGLLESSNTFAITNVRHKNALLSAYESMKRAVNTIESGMPEDFISMDLQQANNYLGQITGDSVDEEIIDRIFTRFCLGK